MVKEYKNSKAKAKVKQAEGRSKENLRFGADFCEPLQNFGYL